MSEASDWIWDVEEPTAIVYQDKLAELKKATKEWRKRVDEYQRRPEVIENLQVSMNSRDYQLWTLTHRLPIIVYGHN